MKIKSNQQTQPQSSQTGRSGGGTTTSSDMGRQMMFPIPQDSPDTYPDPITAIFGPEDFENDNEEDGDYSPTQEEFEAFMRMMSGVELPQQMYMGLPPMPPGPGPHPVISTGKGVIGQPVTSTVVGSSEAIAGPSPDSSATTTDIPNSEGVIPSETPVEVASMLQGAATDISSTLSQVPAIEENEVPKIRVKLSKSQADKIVSSNTGVQGGLQSVALENLLMGQSSFSKAQSAISARQSGISNMPSTSGVQMITSSYTSAMPAGPPVSPTPSSASEMQGMMTDGDDTMDTVLAGRAPHVEAILQTQPVHSRSSKRKSSEAVTTVNTSPSPDTSSVSSRPVKSRPVNVDKVQERNMKNAIQARINREKKKAELEQLKQSVTELTTKNEELVTENESLRSENTILKDELEHVKNVLANQSVLAGLLKDIGHSSKVNLSSSFFKGSKRSSSEAELSEEQPRKIGGGICLHVSKDDVSVEMCSKCSKMANGATRYDNDT